MIYLIRGQRGCSTAILPRYMRPTKVLKQAVNRHANRFPDDFMFVLDRKEFMNWRSQFMTSNSDRMGMNEGKVFFGEGQARLEGLFAAAGGTRGL